MMICAIFWRKLACGGEIWGRFLRGFGRFARFFRGFFARILCWFSARFAAGGAQIRI